MGLTVAVTGPTGEIGKPLMAALERADAVERVVGMARRPFDPAEEGWSKVEYRQGDILDRDSVDGLVAGADVVVHLAFIIFGSHDETRKINLEGTRNVFEATAASGANRLVYTSSVAAYGFHSENELPLREDTEPLGTDRFYYSAQKAELEGLLETLIGPTAIDAYVYRPSIVAGRRATMLVEQMVKQVQVGGRLPIVTRALDSVPFLAPVLPGSSTPFQLVHHDDVADALLAGIEGTGAPGIYNLAGEGELTLADIAKALGWYSVPMPDLAIRAVAEAATRLSFLNAELEWLNALRVPVIMDTERAHRELGWEPHHDAAETLMETVEGARAAGILG